jgi:hypothetical protein
MTPFNTPTYDIERPTGCCAFTGRKLEVGEPYMAVLVETEPAADAGGVSQAAKPQAVAAGLGFRRIDVSIEAWEKGERPENVFGYWRSTVPEANQKKKLFVDDEVLLNLFRRLAEADQPQPPERLAFRFVLALILMRKKALKYDGTEYDALPATGSEPASKREWWRVIVRGDPQPLRVLNPHLDEARIQQVTEQLGEVLEAEL